MKYELEGNEINSIIVHAGPFHADDALCVALIKAINPSAVVERMIDENLPENVSPGTIVADIGKGRFDHHQDDVLSKPDGKKHAAIGLLLENPVIREKIGEKAADELLKKVAVIEDIDNGSIDNIKDFKIPEDISELNVNEQDVDQICISRYVSAMNPTWDSTELPKKQFDKVVEFLKKEFITPIINGEYDKTRLSNIFNEYKRAQKEYDQSLDRAKDLIDAEVDAALKENGPGRYIINFDRYVPFHDQLVNTQAVLVVFPSSRTPGAYNLQCVVPEVGSFVQKTPLDEHYCNKETGCNFLHNAKFFAEFKDFDHAASAAYRNTCSAILENQEKMMYEINTEMTFCDISAGRYECDPTIHQGDSYYDSFTINHYDKNGELIAVLEHPLNFEKYIDIVFTDGYDIAREQLTKDINQMEFKYVGQGIDGCEAYPHFENEDEEIDSDEI